MDKNSYKHLGLSDEQAIKVELHEKEKSIFSNKYYFSKWEEWDFDLTVFSKILESKQFEIFLKYQGKARKKYEEELSE